MSNLTKLEALKLKQEQLRIQIQKVQQKEKQKNRKEETRKKILIGAMVLAKMEKNKDYAICIAKEMDSYLTNDRDRKLFSLPCRDEANEEKSNINNELRG